MDAPRTKTPGLSIVIPTWNGRALLEKFLSSVVEAAAAFEAISHQPTEIVLTDDASTDDTRDWVAKHFPHARCVANEKRQGFAGNANQGVKSARYPLVYLVNNDVALEPATLPPLVEHFANPQVFAVASQVSDFNTGVLSGAGQLGEFRHGFLGIHRRYFVATLPEEGAAPFPTAFASGGSSMYDREKFLSLGGFDTLLSPFGWEDVELSLRAWRCGFTVHYEPRSAVWHRFSSTISPRFKARKLKAVYQRNRLLAHWLHLHTRPQVATHVAFLLLKLLASLLLGRWEEWSALGQALLHWEEVRARRKRLNATEKRPLEEVLATLLAQLGRPGVELLTRATAPKRPYPRRSSQVV